MSGTLTQITPSHETLETCTTVPPTTTYTHTLPGVKYRSWQRREVRTSPCDKSRYLRTSSCVEQQADEYDLVLFLIWYYMISYAQPEQNAVPLGVLAYLCDYFAIFTSAASNLSIPVDTTTSSDIFRSSMSSSSDIVYPVTSYLHLEISRSRSICVQQHPYATASCISFSPGFQKQHYLSHDGYARVST